MKRKNKDSEWLGRKMFWKTSRQDHFKKVIFEKRSEWWEWAKQTNIWGKNILGREQQE